MKCVCGTNVVINQPGHMTKMAAMPIHVYGKKNFKSLFEGTAKPIAMKLI